MHLLFVLSCLLLCAGAGLRFYFSYLASEMAGKMEKDGLFEVEAQLFFAYGLAKKRPWQVGDEKIAQLKEHYEKVSRLTESYYATLMVVEWCDKLVLICLPLVIVLALIGSGVIQ